MKFGELPIASPACQLPAIVLPGWLKSWVWLRAPSRLYDEMHRISVGIGDLSTTIAYNLHYELSGLGCISAAVPGKTGYSAYRRLEWCVGFSPAFSEQRLAGVGHRASVRYTPGFVGALSGATDEYHISMNYVPDQQKRVNSSLPAAWLLRGVLASCRSYSAALTTLLASTVAAGVFITLVGHKKAAWLHIDHTQATVVKTVRWPTRLVVGNEWEEGELPSRLPVRQISVAYKAKANAYVLDEYRMVW